MEAVKQEARRRDVELVILPTTEAIRELERHPNALHVPATTVGGAGEKPFVFVVRNGALVKVPVVTGISTGEWIEIRSGLTGDEDVVANMSPTLTEGAKARAVVAGTTTAATPTAG